MLINSQFNEEPVTRVFLQKTLNLKLQKIYNKELNIQKLDASYQELFLSTKYTRFLNTKFYESTLL